MNKDIELFTEINKILIDNLFVYLHRENDFEHYYYHPDAYVVMFNPRKKEFTIANYLKKRNINELGELNGITVTQLLVDINW